MDKVWDLIVGYMGGKESGVRIQETEYRSQGDRIF